MISHSFAALTREISCSTLEINLVFPRTHVLFSMFHSYKNQSLSVIFIFKSKFAREQPKIKDKITEVKKIPCKATTAFNLV